MDDSAPMAASLKNDVASMVAERMMRGGEEGCADVALETGGGMDDITLQRKHKPGKRTHVLNS